MALTNKTDDMAFLNTGLNLLIFWIAFLICRTIYRLSYHPLAKFPSFKLAAVTKWYERYFDLVKSPRAQYYKEIERMHDQYGVYIDVFDTALRAPKC